MPNDARDPADAAERDPRDAGFGVRLADAGVDVRSSVDDQGRGGRSGVDLEPSRRPRDDRPLTVDLGPRRLDAGG